MNTLVTENAGKLPLSVSELYKTVTFMSNKDLCLIEPNVLHPYLMFLRTGFPTENCSRYLLDMARPVAFNWFF